MENKTHTSLRLSKLLKEAGFEGESKHFWYKGYEKEKTYLTNNITLPSELFIAPAYDILNDLCIKYVKEFFGEEEVDGYAHIDLSEHFNDDFSERYYPEDFVNFLGYKKYQICSIHIIIMIQQGNIQQAEDYIWANCLFNKENKGASSE